MRNHRGSCSRIDTVEERTQVNPVSVTLHSHRTDPARSSFLRTVPGAGSRGSRSRGAAAGFAAFASGFAVFLLSTAFASALAFSSAWAATFWQSGQVASAAGPVLPLAPQMGLPLPGVAMWRVVVVFLLAFAALVFVVIFVLLGCWFALRFDGLLKSALHMHALVAGGIKSIR